MTPSETVQSFYSDISARDYEAAYNLLDARYRHGTSYDEFVNGYVTTQHVGVILGGYIREGQLVRTDLLATDLKNGVTVTTRLRGYWHVIGSAGHWRLDSGSFKRMN